MSDTSVLDRIEIASPCTAKWEEMTGDARTRRCGECRLDVHDISAMTRAEAETFLRERSGAARTCLRIWRRADGTVLTKDCPSMVRAVWKRVAWSAAAVLAFSVAAAAMFIPRGTSRGQGAGPNNVAPSPGTPMTPGQIEMGDYCPPDEVRLGRIQLPAETPVHEEPK